MNYIENCVFANESAFNINMRPSSEWSTKGTPEIAVSPSGRAVFYTILGAISAKYVVSMELRNPQERWLKRIKVPTKKKPSLKGTVTGHYLEFLAKTMVEMDKFLELKGHYIVMDNEPIHTAKESIS